MYDYFKAFLCLFLVMLTIAFQPINSNNKTIVNNSKTDVIDKELKRLQNAAEAAFKNRDYQSAIKSFSRIIEFSNDKQSRDYFDTVIRLAISEKELKNVESAERYLNDLLNSSPPDDMIPHIKCILAQMLIDNGNPDKAYLLLKELCNTIPINNWDKKYRSFLSDVESIVNQQYESVIKNAQRLVDSCLFLEAVPLYKKVLNAIQDGTYPAVCNSKLKNSITKKIEYRLATAYFEGEQYKQAISILKKQTIPDSKTYSNSLYMLTKAFNKMLNHQKALTYGLTYLALDENQTNYCEIQWEVGFAHYKQGNLEEAIKYFMSIPLNARNKNTYYLSRLYLAKIYLQQKSYAIIEDTLKPLISIIPEDNALRYELAYLRGEAFFNRQDYVKACHLFEQAIPKRNQERAKWLPETLYNLGWSHLKIVEKSPSDIVSTARKLHDAKVIFQKLIDLTASEKAYLGLVHVYLLEKEYINSEDAYIHANNILSEDNNFTSPQYQAEALLIRAEISNSFAQREKFYNLLTNEKYSNTSAYALGWYYKGLNEFQNAMSLTANPEEMYSKAISSLTTAFNLLKNTDPSRAGLSLKYAAQANHNKNTSESTYKAFLILRKLINDNVSIFSKMPDQDEVLYLYGLSASRLICQNNTENFLNITENVLTDIIEKFPKGSFVDKSLNLLATTYFHKGLYEKAENLFTKLASDYPKSSYAGDAWFWASECADWQHKPSEIIKFYKLQVFEKYPLSTYAPEAYFNYYSFSDYMQGNKDAIESLNKMEEKYPNTPPMIVAYYLIGLNEKKDKTNDQRVVIKEKDLGNAIIAFENAKDTFDKCYEKNIIPDKKLEYYANIRYKSLLECALINLSQFDTEEGAKKHIFLENAIKIFKTIIADFQSQQNPITKLLSKNNPYPRIYEESEFGLAKAYLINDEAKAENILSRMIEKYASAKISRGYYLSRTWYELGVININRKEWNVALKFLSYAERAATGRVLSIEQYLNLWLHQSTCYRELCDYDNAMLMLSKIINENAMSNLRIKAMYLRAELYELENKPDLAIKQLEVTSKKGGEWAYKAKQKLDKDYGFN